VAPRNAHDGRAKAFELERVVCHAQIDAVDGEFDRAAGAGPGRLGLTETVQDVLDRHHHRQWHNWEKT
jgi:hypothetical protein